LHNEQAENRDEFRILIDRSRQNRNGLLFKERLTISQAQSDDKLQSLTCTRVMVKLC
jgi:hypothetical protein